MDPITNVQQPTKLYKLKEQWSSEGPLGMGLWALHWIMWKTRMYYVLPPPVAEMVQAQYRYTRRVKKYNIQEPIIVYQMGKVGSSSMYWSLDALRLNVPVYHLHYLNDADQIAMWAKKTLRVHDRELKMVALAKKLKDKIDRDLAPRYHLITLVRAPIPRNLSTYFHNIDSYFPNVLERVNSHSLSFQELADYFINEFHESTPERWFDRQVRDIFGLDVYAKPFARERGFQIYEHDNVRMLLIRLEDLNRVATAAMREFLHIPDFALVPANVGENKMYGGLYKEFLASLRLPCEYTEKTNSSQYARHFYTEQELAASVARWISAP
jgi:hypothetical protein